MIGDWVLDQASRAAADAAVRSFEDAGRPPPPAHPIRMALGREVRRVVARLAERLPRPRVIYDRAGLSPYLSRYYVLGGARDNEDGDAETPRAPWEFLNLYLHHFHRGDDDLALHNHPWSWSVSLVLAGGYREERRDDTRPRGADVVVRDVPPLSFNVIRGTDFHRVELLEDDCLVALPRRTEGVELPHDGRDARLAGVHQQAPWRARRGDVEAMWILRLNDMRSSQIQDMTDVCRGDSIGEFLALLGSETVVP